MYLSMIYNLFWMLIHGLRGIAMESLSPHKCQIPQYLDINIKLFYVHLSKVYLF